MNQRVIKAEYLVRGPIAIKAQDYQVKLKKGEKFAFENLLPLNIGNPQALGQSPIQFPREVLGSLFHSNKSNIDAFNRIQHYLSDIHSVEHYTDYRGMEFVRNNIAEFIKKRDQIENITKENIFLTNGAGGGIKLVMESIINSPDDAIMIPIPQYPLYSALIALFGCHPAGYYLKEEDAWSLDLEELKQEYKKHYDQGKNMKALVVINPGNPTGNILSESNIADIIKFCYDHGMIILADEVYQYNVYNPDKKFTSVRSVLSKLPYPYNTTTLFSFHSISKGVFGECGMRGGYVDMLNVHHEILAVMKKLKILDICPNIAGQVLTDLMVKPPTYEDSSKETVDLFNKQQKDNFDNLKIKADILSKELNTIPRISCQKIDGALYAFPKIDIPDFRIKQAQKLGEHPDAIFAMSLLDNTGIVSVPGVGFKQREGTSHIRLTNLINPKEEMVNMVEKLRVFCDDYFNPNSKL